MKESAPVKKTLLIRRNGFNTSFGEELSYSDFELNGATLLESAYTSRAKESKQFPFATVNKCGKGEIVGVYADFTRAYKKARTVGVVDFIGDVIGSVYEPQIKVSGNRFVEVSVGDKDGKTIINLVNSFGGLESQDISTFDWLPPIKGIKVDIKSDKKPARISLQPKNIDLPFEFNGKNISLTVPELEVYEMIVIE